MYYEFKIISLKENVFNFIQKNLCALYTRNKNNYVSFVEFLIFFLTELELLQNNLFDNSFV